MKTLEKIGNKETGQRRLDSVPPSIVGIELLIPRVASLTVDCRGVNISLTIKPIWKLLNEKSVRLQYFVKIACYCCIVAILINFSFINTLSEQRSCVIPSSEALLSKLDGVKSPCIINVKTSAVFKVGIIHCITVISLFSQIPALLFLFLYCNILCL